MKCEKFSEVCKVWGGVCWGVRLRVGGDLRIALEFSYLRCLLYFQVEIISE